MIPVVRYAPGIVMAAAAFIYFLWRTNFSDNNRQRDMRVFEPRGPPPGPPRNLPPRLPQDPSPQLSRDRPPSPPRGPPPSPPGPSTSNISVIEPTSQNITNDPDVSSRNHEDDLPQKPPNSKCGFCEELFGDRELCILPCFHRVHKECNDDIVRFKLQCPDCS